MSPTARVASIDIPQTIAVAFKKFSGEAASSMDDLDIELHRALEWIQHDRKEFWGTELRRRQDRVAEARVQLMQAQTSRRVGDYRPSCVDEQKALERAKRRLATAEQKIIAVRKCAAAIERAVNDCQRARNQFVSWLDTDVQKAITALNRMSDSLDHYVTLAAPAAQTPAMAMPAGSQDASSEFLSAKSGSEPVADAKADAAKATPEKEDTKQAGEEDHGENDQSTVDDVANPTVADPSASGDAQEDDDAEGKEPTS
jgi:hypothetical protein